MNTEKIEELLDKYFEGETSLEEEKRLRAYLRKDNLPDHLKSYREQILYAQELGSVVTESNFDPFAKIEDGSEAPAGVPFGKPDTRLRWALRIAAGLILLLTGFSAGLMVNRHETIPNDQVTALQEEVRQMKRALVYGTGKQLTASERITAVKLSGRFPDSSKLPDDEITDILIYTLNNDANVNVREAAAEALFRFRDESKIRNALVASLSRQRDPLMQITLINMLVEIKETSALNEMQKMLMDSDTREVVKTRLETGIAELKT